MEILNKINPKRKDIESYFSFLFEKGFDFRFVNFSSRGMLHWEVILESSKCLIHIYEERREICLTFGPHNAINSNNEIVFNDQIAIQAVIYFLSKGENFIGLFDKDFYRNRKKQFGVLANLLKEYIDQIIPYFGNYEFRLRQNDMLAAQDAYNNLLVKTYVQKGKPNLI